MVSMEGGKRPDKRERREVTDGTTPIPLPAPEEHVNETIPEQNSTTPESTESKQLEEHLEYQSRDEGIVVIHEDGTERLLTAGSEEEQEVARQMSGLPPSGKTTYTLRMLDADGPASKKKTNPEVKPSKVEQNTASEPKQNTESKTKSEPTVEELLARLAAKNKKAKEGTETPPIDRDTIVAEEILKHARADDFQLHTNAEWTGRDGELQTYYTHIALPKYKFTQEQITWLRNGRQGPMPPFAGGGGGNGGGGEPPRSGETARENEEPEKKRRRVGDVLRDGSGGGGTEKPSDWSTNKPGFEGLKPKLIRELLKKGSKDEVYFGMLLRTLAGDEVADEIKRKSLGELLSPEEMSILEYCRYEYARRSERYEELQKKLNVADFELMAYRDETFKQLLGYNGPERTLEIFRRELKSIAMKNSDAFDSLYNAYTNLEHLRSDKKYLKWERDVNAFCKKHGITLRQYDEMFKTSDKSERVESRRHIQEDIRQSWGPMMRVIDRVTGTSFKRADRQVRKADKLNQKLEKGVVRDVHNELSTLLSGLQLTFTKNPEVMLLVQQEAFQDKNLEPASLSAGPHTYVEARNRGVTTSAEVEKRLNDHVNSYRVGGRDWDHMTVDEREASLAPFRRDAATLRSESGEGWFASAMRALWESFFKRKHDELIHKPVLT